MVTNNQFHEGDDITINAEGNSPIMIRSSNSTQTVTVTDNDMKSLAQVIKQIRTDMPLLKLAPDESKDVEATLKSIEAQLEANKPSHGIIREGLQILVTTFSEKAAEKGVETAFTWLPRLPALLAIFHQLGQATGT